MPNKYKIKDTSIGIKKEEIAQINKLLYPGEKLSKFGQVAIVNELEYREERKLAELTSSQQYHKIKNMEQDIEDLKKKTDFLNSDLNYFKTEYDYDEKHIKHGNLEKELAQHRKEDPETIKVLDEIHAEMDRRWKEYEKKKFLEDGKYTEKDWIDWEKRHKKTYDDYKQRIRK